MAVLGLAWLSNKKIPLSAGAGIPGKEEV